MSRLARRLAAALALAAAAPGSPPAAAQEPVAVAPAPVAVAPAAVAHVGARPLYLVDRMRDGPLKTRLAACANKPARASAFSIAHRGAPLQFPEHTRESYLAAIRQGAGVVECDVAFTKDRALVCRHAQCDLHTTTDILARPDLANKCTQGFQPAANGRPASAKCCTSDLTLAEFRTLNGKMDGADKAATTVEAYLNGTARWRTDLYAARGTVMSHRDFIDLVKSFGRKFTPELKTPEVPMPFEGTYTQEAYASQMLAEYVAAGVPAADVFPQSFLIADVRHWVRNHPDFGRQAVYLDDRDTTLPGFDVKKPDTWKPSMTELKAEGVRILAPPLWMLVEAGANGAIVPSAYARAAKAAGLDLIAWSLERSGPLDRGGDWYYQTIKSVVTGDGDMLRLVDVLAREVGVLGIFSDWPETTTFYASCLGLK